MPEFDKFYRGVKLVWPSEEAHPYHALHWSDDPRKHPWCEPCGVRRIPVGPFFGEPDQRPDDVNIEVRSHDPAYAQRTLIDAYSSLGEPSNGSRWSLAHEHHSGGAQHNPLCPKCNPEAPTP